MSKKLQLRPLTSDEQAELERISRMRTAPAHQVERARALLALAAGQRVADVAQACRRSQPTVYNWLHRFNTAGLAVLTDAPRSGRPATYSEAQRSKLVATALTNPQMLGLPFRRWTLDRLVTYAHDRLHIPISRSHLGELLQAEGLRRRQEKSDFTEQFTPHKGSRHNARQATIGPESYVALQ